LKEDEEPTPSARPAVVAKLPASDVTTPVTCSIVEEPGSARALDDGDKPDVFVAAGTVLADCVTVLLWVKHDVVPADAWLDTPKTIAAIRANRIA